MAACGWTPLLALHRKRSVPGPLDLEHPWLSRPGAGRCHVKGRIAIHAPSPADGTGMIGTGLRGGDKLGAAGIVRSANFGAVSEHVSHVAIPPHSVTFRLCLRS